MCVDQTVRKCSSCHHTSSSLCTAACRCSHLPGCSATCCKCKNMLFAPGTAVMVLHNDPRRQCHLLLLQCLWLWGNSSRSCAIFCALSAGIRIRKHIVSNNQPSTIFQVDQYASPHINFLIEFGSCQCLSPLSFGQKMQSIVENKCQVTWHQLASVP